MVRPNNSDEPLYAPVSLENFISDYVALLGIVCAAPLGSFAYTRLQLLEVSTCGTGAAAELWGGTGAFQAAFTSE